MLLKSHYMAQSLPHNDGYTWTLATRLGAMLKEIECLYGPRDKDYTPIGIEFSESGPQIWFPGNCKHIAIQLNLNALNQNVLACYQLAHEAIHLLAPDGQSGAPVLEEGLATVYSEDFVQRNFGASGLTKMLSYIYAAQRVRELIEVDTVAVTKLRKIEPSFKKMTAETFELVSINLSELKIQILLAGFVRHYS